jgi:hypothetical protein
LIYQSKTNLMVSCASGAAWRAEQYTWL